MCKDKHFLAIDKETNSLTVLLQKPDDYDNFYIFCCDETCSREWIEDNFEIIKELHLEYLINSSIL